MPTLLILVHYSDVWQGRWGNNSLSIQVVTKAEEIQRSPVMFCLCGAHNNTSHPENLTEEQQ